MKKIIIGLFASLFLLTSCKDREADLNLSVSKWNSTLSKMEAVYNIESRIEKPADYVVIKGRATEAKEYIANSIEEYAAMDLEEDAKPMRDALISYMRGSDATLDVFLEMSAKADSLTKNDVQAYYTKLEELSMELNHDAIKLKDAQREFAKAHHIRNYIIED